MDYGSLLSTAWNTIRKHKVILWFGMLVALPTVLMGLIMGAGILFLNEEKIDAFLNSYAPNSGRDILFLAIFFAAFLLFIAFSYVMTALSFAGVLKGTLELQEKDESISFSGLWDITRPYIGRVLGALLLIVLVLFFLIALPVFLGVFIGLATAGLGFLCLAPFFLLILPVELVGYLFTSLAVTVIVADDCGVFEALQVAWQLMTRKFWSLVLMAGILLFLQWALSMLVMLPMQFAQFTVMFSVDMVNADAFSLPFAILMLIFMPLSGLAQGLGLSFANAAWLLTYLQATAPTAELSAEDNAIEYA